MAATTAHIRADISVHKRQCISVFEGNLDTSISARSLRSLSGAVLFTWVSVSEMSASTNMMFGSTLCKGSVPDRTTISLPISCSQINVLSKINRKPRSLPVGGLIRLSSALDSKAIYGQSLKLTPCVGLGLCQTPLRRIGFNVQAKAYEASSSDLVSDSDVEEEVLSENPSPQAAAQRLKIGIYFVAWWTLNVVFNIYNKKVLNAFPYPWLTSTLSLAVGSLMMWVSWATRLVDAPDTDLEFWKALAPVAVAHTIGHVAATVSMSKVAVSFTHIIKSAEPAFSVLVSRFILGESFPMPVYLSLLPIIGGCALAAATELNFNMTGFMGAMISNLAFVFRNIFSKKGMKAGKSVGGMNYYACLSMMSLALLTPFAFAVEGPQAWAAGWQEALRAIGPQFVWWVAAQSVFYHLYNQVSYMSLNEISPLTFSIGNTMKRVSVIGSSIIIFRTEVRPVNGLGAAIAILGTFLYSQAKQ